jgi:hypothetical protein
VAEAKACVLAVAEVRVASTGSGSRRRCRRWPAALQEILAFMTNRIYHVKYAIGHKK